MMIQAKTKRDILIRDRVGEILAGWFIYNENVEERLKNFC